LNYGTHPKTGYELLKTETLEGKAEETLQYWTATDNPTEMLKNQIPQFPDFARNLPVACKPSIVNPVSELYPQPYDQAQGWGLSFFRLLHPKPAGRSSRTIWWSGVANLIWWADLENGIGGMFASQILPFGGMFNVNCYERDHEKRQVSQAD
jgi:hypothetical protein